MNTSFCVFCSWPAFSIYTPQTSNAFLRPFPYLRAHRNFAPYGASSPKYSIPIASGASQGLIWHLERQNRPKNEPRASQNVNTTALRPHRTSDVSIIRRCFRHFAAESLWELLGHRFLQSCTSLGITRRKRTKSGAEVGFEFCE